MSKTRPRRRSSNRSSRVDMYRAEISQRAGLYYRLGYPPSRAMARIAANIEWDFELEPGGRPSELNDDAIGEIVKATYLRRPSH